MAEYFNIDLIRYHLRLPAFIDLPYLTIVGDLEVGGGVAMLSVKGHFTSLS